MSSTNVLETRIHRHGSRAAARAMEGLLHGYENPMDSPLGLVQPIEIQGLTAKIDRNSVWNFGLVFPIFLAQFFWQLRSQVQTTQNAIRNSP